VLSSVSKSFGRDRVTLAAGSFAFRWFLSIFPVVIALLGLSAEAHFPRRIIVDLVHGVEKALPNGAASVFTTALEHSEDQKSGALVALIIAGIVGIWSASSGMVILEEGLDMAYEMGGDRSFLQKRWRAIPLLVAAVVLGGSASGLVVFGQSIGDSLSHHIPLAGSAFVAGWTVARWVGALVLIGLLFSVIYELGPDRPRKPQSDVSNPRPAAALAHHWRWVSPGACVGTALWAAISVAFSFYTSVSGSYSKTYGAFAGVAILIFWLYLTGIAILLGGEINAAFDRLAEQAEPPGASGAIDHAEAPLAVV